MEHDLLHRLFAADGLFISQISAHSVRISWETGYDEPDTPPRNDESARRCLYHTSPTGHAFHRHHPTSSINQYHFPPYTRPRPKEKNRKQLTNQYTAQIPPTRPRPLHRAENLHALLILHRSTRTSYLPILVESPVQISDILIDPSLFHVFRRRRLVQRVIKVLLRLGRQKRFNASFCDAGGYGSWRRHWAFGWLVLG